MNNKKMDMHWSLIHKFLADECTEVEREKVERWLTEDSQHQVFFNSIRKIWEVNPKEEIEVDVRSAWEHFRAEKMNQMDLREVCPLATEYRQKTNTKWYHKKSVYAVAASAIILFVALFMLQQKVRQSPQISYQQVRTAKGEKTNLKLSDGTQVKLNSQSTIKIPSNYGKKKRVLYLSGEAFFKVAHDVSRPFKVYAKGVYTRDVGTQFNVRAFAKDSTVEVVVVKGKVALGKQKEQKAKPVFLSAHQRALISGAGNPRIGAVSELSSYIGWTHGELVFTDSPFVEVISQLERWYDVNCIVKDKSLLHQKLTATFQNEPLSNVLTLIAKSMNVIAKRTGQEVTFRAKGTK